MFNAGKARKITKKNEKKFNSLLENILKHIEIKASEGSLATSYYISDEVSFNLNMIIDILKHRCGFEIEVDSYDEGTIYISWK